MRRKPGVQGGQGELPSRWISVFADLHADSGVAPGAAISRHRE